jgi:hypothetical protein
MFRPTGGWIAYVSDESGRDEVYAQRFPAGGERIPVSTRGGRNVLWSRDGRELCYREGTRLMSVQFDAQAGTLGPPRALFDAAGFIHDPNFPNYDIDASGERFLMIQQGPEVNYREIRLILNWTEELKRELP